MFVNDYIELENYSEYLLQLTCKIRPAIVIELIKMCFVMFILNCEKEGERLDKKTINFIVKSVVSTFKKKENLQKISKLVCLDVINQSYSKYKTKIKI